MIVKYSSNSRASSEAIFGSAARGDSDSKSDRDILIVDDDTAVLRARSRALSDDGWSVASYTFNKLTAIANLGALFVQHLKLESSIIFDRGGRLKKLFKEFNPLETYTNEILINNALSSLCGVTPNVPKGPLLSADILYVTVRNFGILRLAEMGIHVYSFSTIVQRLESEGIIPAGGGRHLAALRFLKCLYRSGECGSHHRVIEMVENALAVLPHDHFPQQLRLVNPAQIILSRGPRCSSPAYIQLRDLERRLVALQGTGNPQEISKVFEKLNRWIQDPRSYSFASRRFAPDVRSAMRRYAKSEKIIQKSRSTPLFETRDISLSRISS